MTTVATANGDDSLQHLPSGETRTTRAPYLMSIFLLLAVVTTWSVKLFAQSQTAQYRNPVLFADYSDPDVIREGRRFYLVASSFHFVPGLPILESEDLVHWRLSNHAITRLTMSPLYDMKGGTAYGRGVWAPAVRFHKGLFYLYFPTPDEGIFVVTAPHMTGPWSKPEVVLAGPGWEDPCPFWDDDGQAYLVHSRLGAGPLILHRMSADGKHLLDDGKIIVQNKAELPTLEGPKFYKRNGWYYIFAPFGGVGTGAQTVLRSRNIYGPYEHRTVLEQGSTNINGPHQGGWVDTPDGKAYFLHFQRREAHGRIDFLEPMRWVDDWPLMGTAALGTEDKPGPGQPVAQAPLPVVLKDAAAHWKPATQDEFSSRTLGQMWEWNHNPDDALWSLRARPGWLRLTPGLAPDLTHARNTLTECMQDESLVSTTLLDTARMLDGDHAGLSFLDKSMSSIAVVQHDGQRTLVFTSNGKETQGPALSGRLVQLRGALHVNTVQYSYSTDGGMSFTDLGTPVQLVFSWWKGARPALFAYSTETGSAGKGAADFDWMHYDSLDKGLMPLGTVQTE